MSEYYNDYPTEDDLKAIKNWDYSDGIGLAKFVIDIWHWHDYKELIELPNDEYILRLATGGWSGNEDIIRALNSNILFGSCYWFASMRGGVHYYKIYKLKSSQTKGK